MVKVVRVMAHSDRFCGIEVELIYQLSILFTILTGRDEFGPGGSQFLGQKEN